jgi:recombination protein RecA
MAKDKIKEFFESFAAADEQISFRMAHENIDKVVPAISTGSPLLDDALSCGGLPKGRIIQYYGPTGSGKTLLSMLAIKNAQADDPESIQMFIDVEQTFSASWAQKLGCDPSRILVVDGDTAVYGRDCFEMLLGVPKADAKTHEYVGQSKLGFLDEIAAGTINCNLIIYDSIGACIPPGEDTSAIGKMNMSLLARFLTTTFRKLSLAVTRANVPFICINHKRDNMEKYGLDHTFSGGNTYAHSLSANVYFERINRKDSAVLDKNEDVIGTLIRGSVEKSKFGSWPRKCEFTVDFNVGVINVHKEIAQLAVKYEVVKKLTSVTHEYKDYKWVGYNNFCAAIEESPELAEELKKEIVEARKGNFSKQKEEAEQRSVQVAEKAVRGRPKKSKEE